MSSSEYVRGGFAAVRGPAAALITELLPRELAVEMLRRNGLGEAWREPLLEALAAIKQVSEEWERSGEAWKRSAASAPTAELGNAELPDPSEQSLSLEMSNTISTAEAAERMRISDRQVRNLADQGLLLSFYEGRYLRISAASVNEEIERRRNDEREST